MKSRDSANKSLTRHNNLINKINILSSKNFCCKLYILKKIYDSISIFFILQSPRNSTFVTHCISTAYRARNNRAVKHVTNVWANKTSFNPSLSISASE